MSSAASTVVSEIISCFLKWTPEVRRVTDIAGMSMLRRDAPITQGAAEDTRRVVWMLLGLACSSWHCDIAPWTTFTVSPTDIVFSVPPCPAGKLTSPDLPIYKLLHPQTSYALRTDKTNSPLRRDGPSHGPPSLARHGGGTSGSVFTRRIRQSYEILYRAKLLHCTSKVIKLQRLSFSISRRCLATWKPERAWSWFPHAFINSLV